jgi:hypothetical protein
MKVLNQFLTRESWHFNWSIIQEKHFRKAALVTIEAINLHSLASGRQVSSSACGARVHRWTTQISTEWKRHRITQKWRTYMWFNTTHTERNKSQRTELWTWYQIKNEYSNQLNQIKLALGNRLQSSLSVHCHSFTPLFLIVSAYRSHNYTQPSKQLNLETAFNSITDLNLCQITDWYSVYSRTMVQLHTVRCRIKWKDYNKWWVGKN